MHVHLKLEGLDSIIEPKWSEELINFERSNDGKLGNCNDNSDLVITSYKVDL